MMLYIKTTTDRLELPLIVETSPSILARKLGLNRHSVATMCSKGVNGYYRIEVGEEENEN